MIIPEAAVLRASKWCYRGIWSIFTNWFHVPAEPPTLAGADDARIQSFRPAEGFLRYLKLFFWIGLVLIDATLFVVWVVILVANPLIGGLLALPVFAIMILPDIVAYIAIHLRYDTTWYVLSDRSMRIRRGIWIIHETTITYDNIQNVSIRQGPLQRHFGISDVLVETAGGGASTGKGEGASVLGHSGLLEGIGNAEEVRNLIMSKWQESKSSGLGDDLHHETQRRDVAPAGFSAAQTQLLEEISELAVALTK